MTRLSPRASPPGPAGTTGPVVVSGLRAECAALAWAVPGTRTERCGMGPESVARWLPRLERLAPTAVVVAGVAGGLDPGLRPGDVVVADSVSDGGGATALAGARRLAADLARLGLRVHTGTVLTCDHIVGEGERARLAGSGALAVDMESAAIVRAVSRWPDGVPVAVVRVIVDTAGSPLVGPATLLAGARALLTLRRTGPGLVRWVRSADPAGPADPVHPADRAAPAPAAEVACTVYKEVVG